MNVIKNEIIKKEVTDEINIHIAKNILLSLSEIISLCLSKEKNQQKSAQKIMIDPNISLIIFIYNDKS